ncbi:MAG: tRNA (N(6)-L-threonylcarbamoyladenosine(37)-C(2))-methylthiotransferase MtaB [Alphaproteobacteria bacterium]|nr:tRNA (N(6)-L-threonylcarbamoyladenosine(37)-C(2))-methylthiotransferase MtaB [Alphaproteobacteria bacterium]
MSGTEVITFGCRLNAYESEVIRVQAASAGLADTVIVNTCAVTGEAERQARQTIRRLRRERPKARIVVTGCAAQIDPAGFAAMPEVDRVIGNAEKLSAESFMPEQTQRIAVNDIMSVKETASHLIAGFAGPGFAGRARAFVQVQQGCDHRCTFCIIPFGRGNSRSVPMGEIVSQTRLLVARGCREIVLTGVDLTAYGADLPGRPSLGQMVRRLLAQVPDLARLRLSSLDPVEVDDDLFRLIAAEERLMPHLHLSLQAGDDMVLKRMKRRHSRADAVDLCRRLRGLRSDIVFGADLITGFPTETAAMFASTLDLVDECDLTFLHVFPYSQRKGTSAARMPQVPVAERRERARRLRAVGAAALQRHLRSQLGAIVDVLIEENGQGHTRHYAPITVVDAAGASAPLQPGAIVAARVERIGESRLYGRLAG